MGKPVAIIGSGFAGLSAASFLAAKGLDVNVYEKNATVGGRARQLIVDGFTFDMGPSWYWMPEVFEKFYNNFGYTSTDFYSLKLLDPSFTVIFSNNDVMKIPNSLEKLCELFEEKEKGAADKLRLFMKDAETKYTVSMNGMIDKTADSIIEYLSFKTIKQAWRIKLFSSFSKHVKRHFKNPQLVSLLEFPVLFLGSIPEKIPAMYSLMDHAAYSLGTWYPMGGMGKIIDAMKTIALNLNVKFHLNEPVEKFEIQTNRITGIQTNKNKLEVDAVIGSADYNHIEQDLLTPEFRRYSKKYWEERILSPSCLIYYLGVNKKINKLDHHNLFFDEDYDVHAKEIYQTKKWPSRPLFYVCCSSVTDPHVAPDGMENIFILMPLATGLANDFEEKREEYFNLLMTRLEKYTNENIRQHVVYKKSYCVSDFQKDYNAFKGNAYGLANTLFQSAIFKPKIKSKKINNLFYAGQLTVPGPGVPPSIISGQIASEELLQSLKIKR